MQKKDYQNLHNYVNCVILIYINPKKTAIVVEGGKMKKAQNDVRRRRIELMLGVIFIIIGVLIYSTGKKSWQQDLAEI